jgi:chaperone modulatory protein CbpM
MNFSSSFEHQAWVWLNEYGVCSANALGEVSGLSTQELGGLVDAGVLVPVRPDVQPLSFELRYVVVARQARRLRDDFELDMHGLCLALTLMRRIEQLQQQLNAAHCVPPDFFPPATETTLLSKENAPCYAP